MGAETPADPARTPEPNPHSRHHNKLREVSNLQLTHFTCASFAAMIGYGLPQVWEDAGPLRGPEEEKAGAHDALRVRLPRAHDREGSGQAPGGTDTVAPGEALLTLWRRLLVERRPLGPAVLTRMVGLPAGRPAASVVMPESCQYRRIRGGNTRVP